MGLNKYEKKKIEDSITNKLLEFKFSFAELNISESKKGALLLKFDGASHPNYKNVRLMSHDSEIKETTLYTTVRISIRFLHGKYESPSIGIKIVTYKLTIS